MAAGSVRMVLLVGSMIIAGCSSEGSASDPDGAAVSLSASTSTPKATQSTTAVAPATTAAPTTTTARTASAIRELTTETVTVNWAEPEYVGEFNALWIVGLIPGSRSMLFIEERGQVEEGCEGGIEPLGRLVLRDLDTGSSKVLLPELGLNDTRFFIGPHNRLALIAACDANAWLEGVGTLDSKGNFTFQRMEAEASERVSAGNNAGVSVTWTADGKVLFVNSTRVDAATGERLEPFDEDQPRIHAELVDGTRLVSARSTTAHDLLWVVTADSRLDDMPIGSPDFTAQALYPAVQVRIDAAGERAYATFEDWEDDSVRTVIVGGDELQQLPGTAWPSPSGARLLVSNFNRSSGEWVGTWTVVDPEAGTSSQVPLPVSQVDKWITVDWGASDNELLISVQDIPYEVRTPSKIWLLEIG